MAYFQNLNIFSPNAVFSKIAIGVVVQLAKRQRQQLREAQVRGARQEASGRRAQGEEDADAVKIVVFCQSQKDKKKNGRE